MANDMTVVWRKGGYANFSWQRSSAMDRAHADQVSRDLTRMGFRNYVVNYAQSLAIGLPDTYEFSRPCDVCGRDIFPRTTTPLTGAKCLEHWHA